MVKMPLHCEIIRRVHYERLYMMPCKQAAVKLQFIICLIYLSDAYMFTGNLFSVCIAPEYSHWESNAVVVCGGGMNKNTGAIYRGKIM